jgi:hypothetical protein
MTKKYARELAKIITNEQLADMLIEAAHEVPDWTKPSRSHKGLSRGTNWNLFCKDFDPAKKYSEMRKYRTIEEFGEYAHKDLQEVKVEKKEHKVNHQEPDLKEWL